jgi:hypothetical protein
MINILKNFKKVADKVIGSERSAVQPRMGDCLA